MGDPLPPDDAGGLSFFVGREKEIAALTALLDREHTHLVTISGPGGMGKTRLALAVVAALSGSFADGACVVRLAPLSADAAIVPAVAQALGLDLRSDARRDAEAQLLDYLQPKELLLLLDNFEHLKDAAPLVARMVWAAPKVKVIVTSRERLGLREEQAYPLQGLPLLPWADVAAARRDPLVQLFLFHARRVRPSFSLRAAHLAPLRALFHLVGGMPLAVILAAGRVDVLSPAALAAEVERNLGVLTTTDPELRPRHRDVRAIFDVTWQRLDERERAVFAALSVFRGGFTLEAARAVAAATPWDLARLVDCSLLTRTAGGRLEIHELLRQFAAARLDRDARARARIHDQHLHYFLTLVESYDDAYRRTKKPEWLEAIDVEHNNIRVALRWAEAQGEWENLGRLSSAVGVCWGIRGYLDEAEAWLQAARAHRDDLSAVTLGKVTFALGWIAFERSDYGAADTYYAASYERLQGSGETALIAEVLSCLGHTAQQQADYERATSFCEQSLALYRQRDDRIGIALILNRLGRLAELQGDYERAVELLEESLEIRQAGGDERGTASTLNALAEIARYQGDYRRAQAWYEEALALCRRLGDKRCVAGIEHNLGHVAHRLEEIDTAARYFRTSLKLYGELENNEGVALCLAGLGGVFCDRGDVARATVLLAKADAIFAEHKVVLSAADQAAYTRNLAAARDASGAAAFAQAWARGQERTLAEVLRAAE